MHHHRVYSILVPTLLYTSYTLIEGVLSVLYDDIHIINVLELRDADCGDYMLCVYKITLSYYVGCHPMTRPVTPFKRIRLPGAF